MKYIKTFCLSITILISSPLTACHTDRWPKEASITHKDKKGNNFIHMGVIASTVEKNFLNKTLSQLDTKTKKSLINATNDQNLTPLVFALALKNYNVIPTLIKHGANPNLTVQTLDSTVYTTPLHCCIPTNDQKAMTVLLNNKANIDMPTNYGETPLMIAIKNKLKNVSNFLLSKGANPNYNSNDIRPLDYAFRYDFPFVFTLLKYGAKPNKNDVQKINTACKALLEIAIKERNSQKLLMVLNNILRLNLMPYEELVATGLMAFAHQGVYPLKNKQHKK